MPADFEFLAGGMDARIEDSTPAAKTGIALKELWRDSFDAPQSCVKVGDCRVDEQ